MTLAMAASTATSEPGAQTAFSAASSPISVSRGSITIRCAPRFTASLTWRPATGCSKVMSESTMRTVCASCRSHIELVAAALPNASISGSSADGGQSGSGKSTLGEPTAPRANFWSR